MTTTETDRLTQLKFPIGPFVAQEEISKSQVDNFIKVIASAPSNYRRLTENLSENDLKKTYREGSWNIHKLVNHVADMQMLHFFRMKKALTEPDYKEITLVDINAWTYLYDGTAPVADALDMIEGVTKRFVYLMRSLNEEQFEIAYYHPVRKITLNQKQAIAMTAWHVAHHLEHIKIALKN